MIAFVITVTQIFEYVLRLSQYRNNQCLKFVAIIG